MTRYDDRDARERGNTRRDDRRPPDPQPLTISPQRLGLPVGPQSDVAAVSDCLLRAHATCNVLAPAMQLDYLPPDHVISFMVVLFPTDGINTYRDDTGADRAAKQQSNGVWYATDGGDLALHRAALDMLAQAAGITWLHDQCGRTDDRHTPGVWAYRMTCQIKGLDGRTRTITREYELDLRDGSPAAVKAGRGLANARIHGAQLCESKASNRAVRAALGLRAYTVAEAQRPFVFPVLRWVPDPDDVVVRRMIAAKELGIVGEVYGGTGDGGPVHLVDPTRVVDAQATPAPRQLAAPSDLPDPLDGLQDRVRRDQVRVPVTAGRRDTYDAERAFEAGSDPWDEARPDDDPDADLRDYCTAKGWPWPDDPQRLAALRAHVQGKGRADFDGFMATVRRGGR